MKRSYINKKIEKKFNQIEKLKDDILNLKRQSALISDKNQQFIEEIEDVLVSGRPKKYEKKLVGRIRWKDKYVDEDDPKHPIIIDRTQVVRINGEWV